MTTTLLTIVLPTLVVLAGILLNRNDAARLEAGITASETRLDNRSSALEFRLHSDMMQVIGKLTELEVWVARLEADR